MQQCALPFLVMNQRVAVPRCPKCSKDEVYLYLVSNYLDLRNLEDAFGCRCLNQECRYTGTYKEFNPKRDTSNHANRGNLP